MAAAGASGQHAEEATERHAPWVATAALSDAHRGAADAFLPLLPVSGKFRDFWRRGVRNTRWGLQDVGVGDNEEI